MPSIIIEGPPTKDIEKKRMVVKEVTKAVSKFYSFSEDSITVLIKENEPENVGAGGQLILDRHRNNH